MTTITIAAVENSYSASGRGCTYYRFVSAPRLDGGYTGWARADQLSGAIISSRAFSGRTAAARHSKTDIEVDLPEGSIIKTVAKGRHDTTVERVRDGQLSAEGIKFIGTIKVGTGWGTVIEIDGVRTTI